MSCGFVVERIQYAVWGINVLALLGEMIAIVVAFQFGVCLFQSDIQSLGIFLYARAENSVEFFLGDTTKPRILVEHGNLLQVVQFGEDAHLGELCYTRDEDELQVCALLLDHLIEPTQKGAHAFELFLVIKQAHEWGIVLVKNDHCFFACLLVGIMNQVREAGTDSY